MTPAEIYEKLKANVREELFRVHEICPRCELEDGSSKPKACPVVDEFMVERVINVCAVGVRAMEASERESRYLGAHESHGEFVPLHACIVCGHRHANCCGVEPCRSVRPPVMTTLIL